MRIISLAASNWKTARDFYDALAVALGSLEGHGRNLNAFIDSMVYGGMNAVEPPYTVRISEARNLTIDVREEIELLQRLLPEQRAWRRNELGLEDTEVSLEMDP